MRISVARTARKMLSLVLLCPRIYLCIGMIYMRISYERVFSFVFFHLFSRYVPASVLSLSWEGEGGGGGPQQSVRLWWSSWKQAIVFFHALPSVVVVMFSLSWHLSLKADAFSKNASLLLWRWELPLPSVFKNCLLPLGWLLRRGWRAQRALLRPFLYGSLTSWEKVTEGAKVNGPVAMRAFSIRA